VEMMAQSEQLLARVSQVILPRARVLTAYSGGVDSTVVAVVARQVLGRDNAPAAIGNSPSLPRHELEEARTLGAQFDLDLIELCIHEQDDPQYRANGADRCYHCKGHLLRALVEAAAQRGIDFVACGSNTDDLSDYRPGMTAAKEAGAINPLLEAGLTKSDVRQLARHLGLPNWDKPAAACLASRIPYGTPITLERLSQVEQAEAALGKLGFTGLRVRHHEHVARIELPWEQVSKLLAEPMRQTVVAAFKDLGYHYVTLDLEGFRSGSGNVVLGKA